MDAAFGMSNFIQSMLKGEASIRPEGGAFNALMSWICVNIEQTIGNQSNLFAFLAFHRSVKLCGRNSLKLHMVAISQSACLATERILGSNPTSLRDTLRAFFHRRYAVGDRK